MATDLSKAKSRHAGLLAYSKSLLQELNQVSSEDCEQAKLLGLKNTVLRILEHLTPLSILLKFLTCLIQRKSRVQLLNI